MNVEVRIAEDIVEPYVVVFTQEMTDEIGQVVSAIEQSTYKTIMAAADDERLVVLRPEDIYLIRVENDKVRIYGRERHYTCGKRLYELENRLGKGFMRISKSAVVNLQYLESVEPSFGGMLLLHLKNGCQDYISRKYLPDLKKYLGV